ncbi:MAG: RNA 2',3'-cyclic phosphodiesterase [Candidatus Omnitrophica bacterium]|nr:RNA 2',3'-cyclic phosphodiesterase [Candidatus Omnitrophota bacterium]
MEKEKRAFIAVEISKDFRQEVNLIQKTLQKKLTGTIAWVKPDNIHLTLRFLGHISDAQIKEIQAIIADIAGNINQFNIDMGALGAFPDIANPRVLWVGIHFGFNELNRINALLEEKLESISFGIGEKYFHPHLTIARIKHLDDRKALKSAADEIKPRGGVFSVVDRIVLFQSILKPEGAVYTKIFEAPLKK